LQNAEDYFSYCFGCNLFQVSKSSTRHLRAKTHVSAAALVT